MTIYFCHHHDITIDGYVTKLPGKCGNDEDSCTSKLRLVRVKVAIMISKRLVKIGKKDWASESLCGNSLSDTSEFDYCSCDICEGIYVSTVTF